MKLEPDEQVFINYRPIRKSKKTAVFIELIIFISSLILFIVFYFSDTETWNVVTILMLVYSSLACCFSSVFLSASIMTSYKTKDLQIILTDRKIIHDSKTQFCVVPYEKISSILRRKHGRESYIIDIKLIEPIPNNPYEYSLKGMVFNDYFLIERIPRDNDLIDKLKYLIEKK